MAAGDGSRCGKKKKFSLQVRGYEWGSVCVSVCVRVRARVCALTPAVWGNLAGAKEKGKKPLRCCWIETFGAEKETQRGSFCFKLTSETLNSPRRALCARRLEPLCGPVFCAFAEECVFVSEDFRWSECATGERFLFSLPLSIYLSLPLSLSRSLFSFPSFFCK